MTNTQIISITEFKKHSVVNFNVEDAILNAALMDAQDIRLKEVIGSKLYAKILSLVEANTLDNPANIVYANLFYDYIADVIIRWAIVEVVFYTNTKIRNTGNVKLNSEQSATADDANFNSMTSTYKDKAEFYSEQLRKHIQYNINDYPESQQSTCEDIKPTKSAYFSGTYFNLRHTDREQYPSMNDCNYN